MENVFIENENIDVEDVAGEPKRRKREKGERDRKTLRADPELIERFENALEEVGGSQKDMVQYLVNLLDLDAARRDAPGAADMIEEFNNLVAKLQRTFHYSIELKESAEDRAEKLIYDKLESKDKLIADLQEKNDAQKAEIEALKAEKAAQTEAEAHLIDRVEAAEEAAKKAENAILDKDEIIKMQKAQLDEMESIKKSAAADRECTEIFRSDLAETRKHVDYLKSEIEAAERARAEAEEKCKRLSADHERAIEIERERAEMAKRAAALDAREEAQKKIDSYVAKVEAKDEEISRLKAELVELKLAKPIPAAKKPKQQQIALDPDAEEVKL